MSDETTIDALVVTGTGDRRAGERVREVLEGVDWPAVSPHEYVFIERLYVSGPLSELGAATDVAVRDAWRTAARGSRGAGRVARFADRAELLAHLAADLAAGRAVHVWYWDAWHDLASQPRTERVARLFEREVAWLASIVVRLEELGALEDVWSALDDAGAARVAVAVARRAGVERAVVEHAWSGAIDVEAVASGVTLSSAERERWRRALTGVEATSPVAVLAALVSLVSSEPLSLGAASAARRLVARVHALTTPGPTVADTADRAGRTLGEPRAASTDEAGPAPTPTGSDEAPASQDAPARPDELPAFTTGWGGFVYVVSALQRRELREVVERDDLLVDRPHGWPLVEALVRRLGLDDEDPLAGWFAAWREDDEELPDVAGLELAAIDVYGELWEPDLLRVAGVVRATETHVDVELPASAVRLDLRLAGLDLDPGWVPWLGRVVTIHYVEGAPR